MDSNQPKTAKAIILQYLQRPPWGAWIFGGIVEDDVRRNSMHKASTVARICRMLAKEGVIQRNEIKINDNGKSVVQYRWPPGALPI